MLFKNNGQPVKYRKGTLAEPVWITIKSGQVVDLDEKLGEKLGLEEVKEETPKTVEGKLNGEKVETKVIDSEPKEPENSEEFLKELKSIKGIGKKTAEDIATWGNKEKLIQAINNDEELPFRDDVVEKLKAHFGGN